MHTVFVKLFTRSLLTDPDDGRTLIDLIGEYVPSWLPHRYGWSFPLRNIYDPARFEDFWSQLQLNLDWRNDKRTARGEVSTRVGPYATLSSIELMGDRSRALDLAALPPFTQACGPALHLAYGMLHLYHPDEVISNGGHLIADVQGTLFPAVDERSLRACLPGLAWGNVFGPAYVELFGGADRVRSAPAAEVTELGPDQFWVQLTGDLADVRDNRPALTATRGAVQDHLGADCFAGYPGPLRAPRLPVAAEEGFWSPPAGFDVPEDVQKLLEKAIRAGKTPPPPFGVIERNPPR